MGRSAARRCGAVACIREGLVVEPVSIGTAGLIQGFPTAALRSGLKAVQHQLSGLFIEYISVISTTLYGLRSILCLSLLGVPSEVQYQKFLFSGCCRNSEGHIFVRDLFARQVFTGNYAGEVHLATFRFGHNEESVVEAGLPTGKVCFCSVVDSVHLSDCLLDVW